MVSDIKSNMFSFPNNMIQLYPTNYWPTLVKEFYTKSLCNTVFGFYNRNIFSYVGCKNQLCSSITQLSSFITPIHVNTDAIKPKYVSCKCKTSQLCAKRIGEYDGLWLWFSYCNHQSFYIY